MTPQNLERAGELAHKREKLTKQAESIESELTRPMGMARRKFTCGTENGEDHTKANRHLYCEASFYIQQDMLDRDRALVDAYLAHLRSQTEDIEAELRELGVDV